MDLSLYNLKPAVVEAYDPVDWTLPQWYYYLCIFAFAFMIYAWSRI